MPRIDDGPSRDPEGERGEGTIRRLREESARAANPGPSLLSRILSPFVAALRARNWVTGLVVPVVAAITVGVAVVVLTGANGGSGPAPVQSSDGFPPARDAATDFTAAPSLTGSLSQVAVSGATAVAIGTRPGPLAPLARFFVSSDDGQTWRLATVGGTPPSSPPSLVAGGPHGWVAVGAGSLFTSPNGSSWLPSAPLPEQRGDTVTTLTATASGFLAAGENASGGQTTPVVWTSPDGTAWQRLSGAQLGLAGATGGVTHAAASGDAEVITTGVKGGGSAGWRSADGGKAWTRVTIPAAAGESATLAGLAPLKTGFAAVRAAGPNATVYTSADGATWRQSATLATASGAAFTLGSVSGGPAGAVVTGQAAGVVIAFISADGTTWTGTDPVGSATADQVSGAALTGGGRAVLAGTALAGTGTAATGTAAGTETAAGTGAGDAAGRQPMLSLIGAQGGPDHVNLTAVPGAADPECEVGSVASAAATDVAAGSAGGSAALWTTADGGSTWAPAAGATPGTLTRTGSSELTSVAHGAAGWLAVGGAASKADATGSSPATGSPPAAGIASPAAGIASPAAGPPIVVGSADGKTWTAEDGEGAFAGNGLVASGAAAGAGGYVIVGRQVVNGQSIAAAWFSRGLTGWQTAADAQPGALQGDGKLRMNAVTATAKGFAAAGSDGTKPAAWRSADGRTWSEDTLPLPSGAVSASLSYVAANGETVAAAGNATTGTGQQVPFAEVSANGGASWSQTMLPVPQGGSGAVTALAASGGGFTATGTSGQNVVVWLKDRGAAPSPAWQAETPDVKGLSGTGTHAITALTSSGAMLTGVGFAATAGSEEPTIWQVPVRG